MIESLPVNMRSKISVTPDGCWQWTAALNSKGYGSFNIDKVGKSTHRFQAHHPFGRALTT